MTGEEAIEFGNKWLKINEDYKYSSTYEFFQLAIKAIEKETNRNMEEIEEVINCDADAETKCKMISNILTAEPHYFEEPRESKE